MAFPTSPTNGQTTTQNGQVYTWDAALGVWALTVGTTGDLSGSSVTATANISGGNILTAGIVSADSTITGGNINTGGIISATGNIVGGNINTAGLISAVGNIVGGNIITSGALTAASYSTVGNVTGGNIITAGVISAASISLSGMVVGAGNLTTGNISAAGNVLASGVVAVGGVTPSAWGGTFKALQVGDAAALASEATSSTRLYNNAYYDGTNLRYIGTGNSTQYLQFSDGSHRWYSANSQTAGNVITYSQSLMVDANGNVLVGTTTAPKNWNTVAPKIRTTNGGIQIGDYSLIAEDVFDPDSLCLVADSTENICFGQYNLATTTYTERMRIDTSGHFVPAVTATYDLGTSSLRWRNVYTSDLHLNNGIGNYTIVEGEDDLFLYNNRNGKTYKFALTEVDPSTVPPKMKED